MVFEKIIKPAVIISGMLWIVAAADPLGQSASSSGRDAARVAKTAVGPATFPVPTRPLGIERPTSLSLGCRAWSTPSRCRSSVSSCDPSPS